MPKILKWVEQDNEMQPPYVYVSVCVLRDLVDQKFLSVTDSTDTRKVKFGVTEEGKAAFRRVLFRENKKMPGMYNQLPE